MVKSEKREKKDRERPTSVLVEMFKWLNHFSFPNAHFIQPFDVKSSQVTFIYIALLTIQIVTKQMYNIKNRKIVCQ